jgi:hypothetical protein
LEAATAPGFDPAETAVVEDPDLVAASGGSSSFDAEVVEDSATELRLRLGPSDGGVLTIRRAFDPGWRAEVDGRSARTVPVDGFLQGVVLGGTGDREVVLTYHDDAVTLGLGLGAGIWAVLLAAPLAAVVVERGAARGRSPRRRATRTRPPPPVA